MDDLILLFQKIGLDAVKATETAKNKKLSANLNTVIHQAGVEVSGCDKSLGVMLYNLASTVTKEAQDKLPFLTAKIISGDIKNDRQLAAAVKFAGSHSTVDEGAFKSECGIGINVSIEDIKTAVESVIKPNREVLKAERYAADIIGMFKTVRDIPAMKWADAKILKQTFDDSLLSLLGPKTAQDEAAKKGGAKKEKFVVEAKEAKPATRVFEGDVLKLHKPGENPQIRPELMEKHLKATGGKVITRFPPEPNGFLHIGHAKAMNFNFRYAEAHSGECNLRYDDTNPEAEEDRYYKAIRESVDWLGFKPARVTYASDNFQQLYEYAIELIKKGRAYVCEMTQEEIHASRGGDECGPRYDSPYRNRPIEESLALFEDMKNGKFEEGKVTLRLKMDMQSPNPFMWDLIAYRVLYHPHCRTGKQWNIYPMYDFTHCLCDSLENITHSLCSTEFILAREAYYWVCDNVEVYKPVQWEFGRLRITNTVLSKRKLTKLVSEKIVNSWDDPRLYTLAAVRRRGFTPKSINNFAERLGITTATTTVDVRFLESCVRDDLNEVAPRRMAVLEPLLVKISNLPADHLELIDMPDFFTEQPVNPTAKVPFTAQVYIDRSDFKEQPDENFFRLSVGTSVGLFRSVVITCTSVKKDSAGKVIEIEAIADLEKKIKPKTFIQWVADCPSMNSPVKAEVRLYSDLFLSKNPENVEGGFLKDINPSSLHIISDAFLDVRAANANVEDKFQFQRIGYFCVDPDTKDGHLVFNKTVSLKEDPSKDA